MRPITIAIDGHSSCGKSTMAKWLARELGYIYVDTGAMYRAVTLFAMRHGLYSESALDTAVLERMMPQVQVSFQINPETNLPLTMLCGEVVESEIRGMEVSNHVSEVAALPFVRAAMTGQQRKMGEHGGVVMDGRDIGTAVFPNAELKVFVTASAPVRAQRRYDELQAKGEKVSFEEILHNVEERDYIDSHRSVAPLRRAETALLLDNSEMTIEQQNAWLLEKAKEAIAKSNE